MRKLLFPFVSLLLLQIIPALALPTISEAEFQYRIENNLVKTTQTFRFNEPTTAQFSFPLPFNVQEFVVLQDNLSIPYSLQSGELEFAATEATLLRFQYTTDAFLDGESFVTNIAVPLPTEQLRIALTLPPQAVLRDRQDRPEEKAVYPPAQTISSDGSSLILRWERENFAPGEELALYVRYRKSREALLWLVIGIGVLLFGGSLYYHFSRSAATKVPADIPVTTVPANAQHPASTSTPVRSDLIKHLKEDEQQIVKILQNREGSCEQGTLRVITGFSKAKLSGLLSELEKRNIIHKEQRGKKNVVFLKEQ